MYADDQDHKIVVINDDLMQLRDNTGGDILATARRENGEWTVVHARDEDLTPSTHLTKQDAHLAMIERHAELFPNDHPELTGYATWVPHAAYDSIDEARNPR